MNCGVVIIYTLSDPRTGEVRYVGKTERDLESRLRGHLNDLAETRKARWIRKLMADGVKPLIETVESMFNPTEEEWKEAERFWIEILKFYGCNLTNLSSGGETWRHSQESLRKMSSWQIGRKLSKEHVEKMRIAFTGKRHSEETRNKMRISHLGKPRSEQHRINLSLANKGKKPSLKTIEMVKLANTGRVQTQEEKDRRNAACKLALALRGPIKVSPETKLKLSLALKGKKRSKAVIENQSLKLKEWHAKQSEEYKLKNRELLKASSAAWYARLTSEQMRLRVKKQQATVMAKKQALEGCLINN